MAATFVVVPQWQGSGSSRAMQLADGAEAIRGDLPSGATRVVEVPVEAGDAQGSGVHRLSSIVLVRDRLRETLDRAAGVPIVIGGDCGVELGAVGHAVARHGDAAVVWFDAHPDLHTPGSSPSGAFAGMVLRTLLGDGEPALVPQPALPASRLVLAGARSVDPAETAVLDALGIPIADLSDPDAVPAAVVAAVRATGAGSVYLHVDLDVLDPADFAGLDQPEPFGLALDQLLATIAALRAEFALAGAGITQFSPPTPAAAVDGLPTILRIVGALTR